MEIARPDFFRKPLPSEPPENVKKQCFESDDVLRLREYLDHDDAGSIDDETKEISKISFERIFVGRGGLGINSVRFCNIAARIGATKLAAPLMSFANISFFGSNSPITAAHVAGAENEHLFRKLLKKKGITLNLNTAKPQSGVQHIISREMRYITVPEDLMNRAKKLEQDLPKTEVESRQLVARFTSVCTPQANAWQHATSEQIKSTFPDVVAEDAILKHIGCDPPSPKLCAKCNMSLQHNFMTHAISSKCNRTGVGRAGGAVKDTMMWACRTLGIRVSEFEPLLADCIAFRLKANMAPKRVLRGDWKAFHYGETIVFDASHTAMCPKNSTNSDKAGWEATATEKSKLKSYTDIYEFRKGLMVPLVVDIFGAWGDETRKFFAERNKDRKVLLKESVWGKVKTIVSIGACHAYTARVSSVREYIPDPKSKKKAATDASRNGPSTGTN